MNHEKFGQLRSLIAKRPLPIEALMNQLDEMYRDDPQRYIEQLIGYLEHVPWPRLLCCTEDTIEQYDRLLPSGIKFRLRLTHYSHHTANLDRLFAHTKRIEALSFSGSFTSLTRALAKQPLMLKSLYIHSAGDFNPAKMPDLPLEYLSLYNCQGAWPWLEQYPSLKQLELIDADLELSGKQLHELKYLTCSNSQLTGQTDALLFNMPKLVQLDVGRRTFDGATIEILLGQGSFQLEDFRADASGLTSTVLETLSRHPLRQLDLADNPIESLEHLPKLPQLMTLNLNGCPIKHLGTLDENLPSLTSLCIDRVELTRQLFELCLNMPHMKNLETFDEYIQSREAIEHLY